MNLSGDHPSLDFRPWRPETKADPFSYYARLRAEAPVRFHERLGVWSLARHADVERALRDWQTYSSAGGITVGGFAGFKPMLITMDPPRHDELRKLVARAFTPRRVAVLEARMRSVASSLLEPLAAAGTGDLLADFARPYPATVIAELLGVSPADQAEFCRWSDEIMLSGADHGVLAEAYEHLFEYFETTVARRRREPAEDLVSALVRAQATEGSLSDDELLGFCALLLIAGHETMTNFISLAAITLQHHADVRERLRSHPEAVAPTIEELLRYEPPVHAIARTLRREVTIDDHVLPAGEMVLLLLASANRDETVFSDADTFDPDRGSAGLAFGFGTHYCMGAGLARLEARVALDEMLRLVPDVELAHPIEWRSAIPTRGPAALPFTTPSRVVSGRTPARRRRVQGS